MKIHNYCVLLNQIKGSKTCKVEAIIGDGFINETRATSGMSHLVEHILLDSWKKCYKNGCSDFWKDYGVMMNAETTNNAVRFYMEGLAEYTPKMIAYIISITTDPKITPKRIEKEKLAVINELLNYDEEATRLMDCLNKMTYTNEGLYVSEDRDLQLKNLKHFNLASIKEWVQMNYCKNNTIFIISGDFNKSKTIKQITSTLKKSALQRICNTRNYSIFKRGVDLEFVREKEKDNTTIVLSFPQHIDSPNKALFYIDFFLLFIDNGVESLLMLELREKKSLIYNTAVDSIIYSRASVLSIEISTRNSQVLKVIRETIKILKKIVRGDFTQATMNDIKRKFMVEYYQKCLNNDFYTDFYGTQLLNQLEVLDKNSKIYTYEEVANLITNLTKSQFVAFVKHILDFSNMKLAYQGKREISLTKKGLERILL